MDQESEMFSLRWKLFLLKTYATDYYFSKVVPAITIGRLEINPIS